MAAQFDPAEVGNYERLYATCTAELPAEPLLQAIAACGSAAPEPEPEPEPVCPPGAEECSAEWSQVCSSASCWGGGSNRGSKVSTDPNFSLADCQADCEGTVGCQTVEFWVGNGYCYHLSDGSVTDYTAQVDSGYPAMVYTQTPAITRHCSATVTDNCCCEPEPASTTTCSNQDGLAGYDGFPGHPTGYMSPGDGTNTRASAGDGEPVNCRNLCTADATCVGFLFSASSCYVYTAFSDTWVVGGVGTCYRKC